MWLGACFDRRLSGSGVEGGGGGECACQDYSPFHHIVSELSTWVDIQKRAMKICSHSFRMTCDKSAVNQPESGEKRYVKAIVKDSYN